MSLTDKDLRSTPAIHDIPLDDLESGPYSGKPGFNWTNLSDFTPANMLARPDRLSSQARHISDHWQVYLYRWLRKLGIALTPSYLQHWVGGEPPQLTKLHAIAALDGLRGWACLLVFNFHFLFTYTWKVAVGWGFNGENYGILHLPIIHLLVSGHIMVAIFFVISGYVLSYKPLKMIRTRSWDQTLTVLASSTFRRGFRLYIPSIVGIFLVFVAVRLGVFNYSHRVVNQGDTILGTNEQHPPLMKSFTKQFGDWYRTVAHLIDPWNWALYYNYYNPHLWTIPVEFRCSIVLFLTIIATSRVTAFARLTLVSGLIWFCMRWGRWDVVLFLFGMLMAEADLLNGTWERPVGDEKPAPRAQCLASRLSSRKLWIALFVFGLYLGSAPNTGYKWTPFYMWTWKITPRTYPEPHRFPQTLGAVLIVYSINHSKDIQKLFVNRLSQYLGKISYAFYIVHGPILHSLGYSLMPNIWSITGKNTDFRYCLGFFIGWLICLPVSLWAGDVFWRAVDIPSVKFARWLEDKLAVKMGRQSQTPSSHIH
ncbi:acyltransferase family protein [Aspergillus clavatus NRRL 1]|uniref:Acyltransferase, putative n=1 Tax=Aspergillus clavatus (strain ATCC 1007 / CBS 513.65 / DSM 816 / NCTC 3887 / NRRL 1 / QM 1276 / 107) TaxID=344612 RepID=A1CHG4_ASPCL|nr:acyltransferase, putative [Aspergillus clavatus NRRL 1]EAW10319.1 acyltransferase, putative [Aspergillus clavatus NRRL 1]